MRLIKKSIFLGLLASALICGILYIFNFYYLDSLISDYFFRIRPNKHASKIFTLIAVDKRTIESNQSAYDLKHFNSILQRLALHPPKVILSLISPEKLPLSSKDEISKFKDLSSRLNLILGYEDAILIGEEYKLILPKEFGTSQKLESIISFDRLNFAGDGVARRAFIDYHHGLFAQPFIASYYNKISVAKDYRGYFKNFEATQIYINYNKPGSYPVVSAVDFARDFQLPSNFSQHIVIIGFDDQFTPEYYVQTPFSRSVLGMSKLEANAHVIDTFLQNSGIIKPSKTINFIISLLIIALASILIIRASLLKGLIYNGLVLFIYLASAYTLFSAFDIQIGNIHTLLGLFICYYLISPYKLAIAQKKLSALEKTIEQAKVASQSAKADLGFRIAAQVAHDLKSPLTVLKTINATISGANPKTISLLSQSVSRIESIGEQLLTRFRSGSLYSNTLDQVNLLQLLSELLESFHITHPKVQFKVEDTSNLGLRRFCHKLRNCKSSSNTITLPVIDTF